MKKLTKKLSLNKKTVADLGSGMQANVKGGVINKTDYTYCTGCISPPFTNNTCGPTCVATCDATCAATCNTCQTACSPCGGFTDACPATNPTGFPCQKDNCYN